MLGDDYVLSFLRADRRRMEDCISGHGYQVLGGKSESAVLSQHTEILENKGIEGEEKKRKEKRGGDSGSIALRLDYWEH